MYVLVLVFFIVAGESDGGVAIQTLQPAAFATQAECKTAGSKAVSDLGPSGVLVENIARNTTLTVKYTCLYKSR